MIDSVYVTNQFFIYQIGHSGATTNFMNNVNEKAGFSRLKDCMLILGWANVDVSSR